MWPYGESSFFKLPHEGGLPFCNPCSHLMTANDLIHMLLTSTRRWICRHLLFQNTYFYNAVRLLCHFFYRIPDLKYRTHYIKYSPGLYFRPSVQRPYNIQVFASNIAVQLNVFPLQNSLKKQHWLWSSSFHSCHDINWFGQNPQALSEVLGDHQ